MDFTVKTPIPAFVGRGVSYLNTEEGITVPHTEPLLPRMLTNPNEEGCILIRNEDPDNEQPTRGYISRVYIFDLDKPDDVTKYAECLNQAGTGTFYGIHFIERHWVDKTSNWKVLLEICEEVRVPPRKTAQ